jgi:hypothetical protein
MCIKFSLFGRIKQEKTRILKKDKILKKMIQMKQYAKTIESIVWKYFTCYNSTSLKRIYITGRRKRWKIQR